jgi:DNA-binding response OmpR family regulator
MNSPPNQELAERKDDVLMIEDEPELLEIFLQEFGKYGLRMRSGPDPTAALAEFERRPVPVVITDLRLPGLSGVEIIRRIKTIQPITTLLVVSGFVDSENILACFRAGASDILFKPLSSFELLAKEVTHAVARHRRWQQTLFNEPD